MYYKRALKVTKKQSFFLFGPRGTGKTTWLKHNFPDAVYINLLDPETYNVLLVAPQKLEEFIGKNFFDWIIIDEIQKIPELLNVVHKLIEEKKVKFILTGSNARKLRRKGINLLAGRALVYNMYPLTARELGNDFILKNSLEFGNMPMIYNVNDKKKYLESYAMTHMQQEILQEGWVKNLPAFARFLRVAGFSQGSLLNMSAIAQECAVNRKVVENYFSILDDLLVAYFLPPFTKRAKRVSVKHNKFYYFDAGVYRILRPRGPLDILEEVDGAGLETLVLQELKAVNEYEGLGYEVYFWRTVGGAEVDFVLYGEKGFIAIEVKRKATISNKDLRGLKSFQKDYPQSKGILLYGGKQKLYYDNITALPLEHFFKNISEILS